MRSYYLVGYTKPCYSVITFERFYLLCSFPSGESVDMLDWFSQLTFEVILSTAFGVDANIQMEENTEMLQKAQAIFKIPLIVPQIERFPFGTLFFSLLSTTFGNQPTYFSWHCRRNYQNPSQSRSQSFVPLDQRSENESSGSNHFRHAP